MKKILFAASECTPFCSSGGLGDVIGSLPLALAKEYGENADIRVVLPLYGIMAPEYKEKLTKLGEIYVDLAWRKQYCGIFCLKQGGITYYFLDNEYYFKRDTLYGHYDDGERFAFFSKAVLCIMPYIDFFPDIFHAHDWQTALSVVYLKRKFHHTEGYNKIKTVFTIHNIQYQGIYDFSIIGDVFDLPESEGALLDYDGDINLMKAGIVCADKVSTVSPTYAKEILSPMFSHGLHSILEQNKQKLCGILNGIDKEYYNPSKNKELFANFSYRKMEGKAKNKAELQKMLGLPERPDVPLIALISRLVDHKGLDLLSNISSSLLERDVQLVILGKGDYYYEDYFYHLAERYGTKAVTLLTYNRDLSKKIYAASDIFIMPSRTEPCGLSQMIASRYGSVPVVRETGGLYDSIKDVGCEGGGNGFTFAPYSPSELLGAIDRAVSAYHSDSWSKIVRKVMMTDFSWNKSAKEYIEKLYS